jgi:hypothetical protein
MEQMTLFASAGIAVVTAFYAGVRIGQQVGQRAGALGGAAKMLGVFAIATRRN